MLLCSSSAPNHRTGDQQKIGVKSWNLHIGTLHIRTVHIGTLHIRTVHIGTVLPQGHAPVKACSAIHTQAAGRCSCPALAMVASRKLWYSVHSISWYSGTVCTSMVQWYSMHTTPWYSGTVCTSMVCCGTVCTSNGRPYCP